MSYREPFTERDLVYLSRIGISEEEVQRQQDLFQTPPPKARLVRPCSLGDGIEQLSEDRQTDLVKRWRELSRDCRLAKMVPASGAASRMFKDLTAAPAKSALNTDAVQVLIESLPRFAFFNSLQEAAAQLGPSLDSLIEHNEQARVLELLLEPQGLDYRSSPKGLILFHSYSNSSRTAIEEQIREGYGYLADAGGLARLHFTVAQAHKSQFQDQIARIHEALEETLAAQLQVEFSTQSPTTDTIAVDLENRPLRQDDGHLVLRPAGHGALLDNLQKIDADVVFIKNIDNISHMRLHPTSVHWKRVLAGYFAEIQRQVFDYASAVESRPGDPELLDQVCQFLQTRLAIHVSKTLLDSSHEKRLAYVRERLDRPLRVCGMVKNEGEPGGGPHWLPDSHGGLVGQIIEPAQVDLDSQAQAEIWKLSTHFNPVDLVCGLRDRHGRAFRLSEFVDPASSFVAHKSQGGRAIKVLERPGLWNGSMARWNTAFVEVPLETFTPVKTVFDLLRAEHQP